MPKLPLEGIRIIESTVIVAGPSSAMFLADLGAEVIRLEPRNVFPTSTRSTVPRPTKAMIMRMQPFGGGYPNREPGTRPWNRFPWFNSFNRNKFSMTLNLSEPTGMEVFKKLVKVTDIFLENNVPNVMDKLGISYEMLKEIKPDIIMMRMPGYGTWGPYKNYRAIAPQFEGAFGHTLLRGYTDMDPSSNTTGTLYGDLTSGCQSAFAMLCALHYKKRTGQGQYVELAQSENVSGTLGQPVMEYTMNNRQPTNYGNRHASAAPCGAYRCQGGDNWVNITCHNDEEWEGFCRGLGNPAWTRDERFADAVSRWKNQDELDKHITEWTLQQDKYKVMHLLQKEGVPAAPVLDQKEMFEDPHFKARGYFEKVTQADCGTHLYPGVYWKLSKTPLSIRRPPPLMGEHNERIYKELVGVSNEQYEELKKIGHIGMDFLPGVLAKGQVSE